MKKITFTLVVIVLTVQVILAQCPPGSGTVLGQNCGGCCAGFTGGGGASPCGGAIAGNCGSEVTVTSNVVIPAGCQLTITLTPSGSCGGSAGSGFDTSDDLCINGNCVAGNNNSFASHAVTLTGTGASIAIEIRVNRRDEIGTYTFSSCSGCALPVEWLSVGAIATAKGAILNWITAQELNNDYFEVQLSKDGIEYSPIGIVDAVGNSNEQVSYEFEVTNRYWERTFFRVRQVDTDGSESFSNTIEVFNSTSTDFNVYPNPSSGNFSVILSNSLLELPTQVSLFRIDGQLIETRRNFDSTLGEVYEYFSYSAGIYIVQVQTTNGIYTQRVIVQ